MQYRRGHKVVSVMLDLGVLVYDSILQYPEFEMPEIPRPGIKNLVT